MGLAGDPGGAEGREGGAFQLLEQVPERDRELIRGGRREQDAVTVDRGEAPHPARGTRDDPIGVGADALLQVEDVAVPHATGVEQRREGAMLTRSLPARPPPCVLVVDARGWRLAYLPELREGWWAVPGSRRLGLRVRAGLA